MTMDLERLKREVEYRTSRAGGPGGQNVNKVETKVTLLWQVEASQLFSSEDKFVILSRLKSRINEEGYLIIDSSETRSQLANKNRALQKLNELLAAALIPIKKRKATKIPKAKILERLDRKKRQANKKNDRRWKMD